MTQPLFQQAVWTVTELTRHIRTLLENDLILMDVWVNGEVSNMSRPQSGHIYFTVKDNNSSLRCVIWRSTAHRLTALPQDGDAVQIHGSIGVYEAAGQYQLYADDIRLTGEGDLYQEFLQLKRKLEAKGLFDQDRKKQIPPFPSKIGIITSPTGSALRDILNTIKRRYSNTELILAPTPVQGKDAPKKIIQAIDSINLISKPDVIILARGGGSIEDLWAFNDEQVASAIANSAIPVICGVGHETDFTIADFVCDFRAPIPTAAAEIATPDRHDLLYELAELAERLRLAESNQLAGFRLRLNQLSHNISIQTPANRLQSDRQRLDELLSRATIAIINKQQLKLMSLNGITQNLDSLNPIAAMNRGFAIVKKDDGTNVRRVTDVSPGEHITVHVKDGYFDAGVENIHKGEEKE